LAYLVLALLPHLLTIARSTAKELRKPQAAKFQKDSHETVATQFSCLLRA